MKSKTEILKAGSRKCKSTSPLCCADSSVSCKAPPSLDINSSSDRAREASACEIILASHPDVAFSVCCFQIFLPPESILLIEACLIVDQFKRSSLLSCRDFAIIVLLETPAQIGRAARVKPTVNFGL
jgi:hypothetical protein